jgi:FkbM family methyltransferase
VVHDSAPHSRHASINRILELRALGARLRPPPRFMPQKIGSYQSRLSRPKDLLDFWLTRFPGWYLMLEERREWQNWDKRVYLSVIERGDIVLDIGANVGAHTIAFSHMVGAEGKVIALEPVPANFERLRETVSRRARYSNVEVLQAAAGNPAVAGVSVIVKVPGDDFTQASLVEHSAGSWQESSDVREYEATLTSLDAEAARIRLERLDFVKIDVEGGELDVMKGGEMMLRRLRPLVYCEIYEKWVASFGHGPDEMFSFMRSLGYDSARIIRDGKVHALALSERIPEGLFAASADVLFVAPEHALRVARFDDRYVRRGRTPGASADGA